MTKDLFPKILIITFILFGCESNDADVCGICAGDNKDLSVCSKSEFTNKNECEQLGSTWTASFQGPNIALNSPLESPT